jgi:hypothetical protein
VGWTVGVSECDRGFRGTYYLHFRGILVQLEDRYTEYLNVSGSIPDFSNPEDGGSMYFETVSHRADIHKM